jgi:hypothetical protein
MVSTPESRSILPTVDRGLKQGQFRGLGEGQ